MSTTIAPPVSPQSPGPSDTAVWHTLAVNEALKTEGVEPNTGLTTAEVAERTRQYGPNKFAVEEKESTLQRFLRQYQDPMQMVLVVAGLITIVLLREWGT